MAPRSSHNGEAFLSSLTVYLFMIKMYLRSTERSRCIVFIMLVRSSASLSHIPHSVLTEKLLNLYDFLTAFFSN